MADYRVRGKDERVHVFRHDSPGLWKHYSRPVWERFALEREEDDRSWTLAEVKAWIDAEQAAPEPITEEEIAWVHKAVEKGFNGKSATETVWPADHKPEDVKLCQKCNDVIIGEPLKWGWYTQLDRKCYEKAMGENDWGIRHFRGPFS